MKVKQQLYQILSSYSLSVCSYCCKYIAKGRHNPKFEDAWPAVFWTYLSKTVDESVARKFLGLMTTVLSSLWKDVKNLMSPTVQRLWTQKDVRGIFLDRTDRFSRFTEMWKKPGKCMDAATWTKLADETSFHDVRCPAGCSSTIDDPKFRHISVKHVLQYIDKSFVSFRSDRSFLQCARLDWMTKTYLADRRIGPTLAVTKHEGL